MDKVSLGARNLPVRVFIDPNADTLFTTNTNAGTTLKQVAFDKSVQRHLGSALYQDRVQRYQAETGRAEDDIGFSERDLVNHFKGQSREIKRFILDALRNGVTSDPENKLMDFKNSTRFARSYPILMLASQKKCVARYGKATD